MTADVRRPVSNSVLDASAVLALLNDEPGADQVESVLEGSIISAVNQAEVLTKLIEAGMTPKVASEAFDMLGIETINFDSEQALKAASLRPVTKKKGLSLGDRCCLALAVATNRDAITAERSWADLKICPVVQIR